MGIEKDDDSDNQLLKLDDDNKSNLIYHNLEDKLRFDLEATADNKKNEDKIGSKIYLDLEVETIVA